MAPVCTISPLGMDSDSFERLRQTETMDPNSINDGPKTFGNFRRLPVEIRMKIWKLAMPGGRLFEPGFETRQRCPDHWQGGTWTDHHNLPLDPPTLTVRKKFQPPSLRAVCRESRQVSDEVGGFKFGLMGGVRHGFWFNYNNDIVFLGRDMAHKRSVLNLSSVRILAFSQHAFKTKGRCNVIFYLIATQAFQCRVVEFHLQHLDGVAADNTKRYELADTDEIGHYCIDGSKTFTLMKWGTFRDALSRAWDDYLAMRRQRDVDFKDVSKPRFVGFDMV